MDDGVARKNPPPGAVRQPEDAPAGKRGGGRAAVTAAGDPVDRSPPDHMIGRVLKPRELLEHARYVSIDPAEALAPWVERYWSVSWNLSEGERYRATTVSEPAINLTREWGDLHRAGAAGPGLWVTGPVTRTRFDVELSGTGGVIGVRFHLGGTLAFSPCSPVAIVDATVPARHWFPRLDEDWGVPIDLSPAAEVLDRWLLAQAPEMTEGYERLRRVLAAMSDPEVTSLQVLAEEVEMSQRSLQRLFRDHCGVGVKKILTRARVIDAVAALENGWDGSLADLAAALGWFDQSHFTADFVRVTGYRPTECQLVGSRLRGGTRNKEESPDLDR